MLHFNNKGMTLTIQIITKIGEINRISHGTQDVIREDNNIKGPTQANIKTNLLIILEIPNLIHYRELVMIMRKE